MIRDAAFVPVLGFLKASVNAGEFNLRCILNHSCSLTFFYHEKVWGCRNREFEAFGNFRALSRFAFVFDIQGENKLFFGERSTFFETDDWSQLRPDRRLFRSDLLVQVLPKTTKSHGGFDTTGQFEDLNSNVRGKWALQ